MTHEDAIAAILAREQEKGVVTEAELRQQLADVTNERDTLRLQLRTMTADRDNEKRMKACARIQRDLQCDLAVKRGQDLRASEARNAVGGNNGDAVTAFNERHCGYEFPSEDLRRGALNTFCAGWFERHKLAQSAPATDPAKAELERLSKAIYEGCFCSEPGFVPWVDGGNSIMQDKARDQARRTIEAARMVRSATGEQGAGS